MITFDGDRSRKRKWFGDKLIRTCKAIDVPSKAALYEGFTITAWQQDELSGGRITAPMGAVVMCSTLDGIKVSVADYWAGAFTTLETWKVIYGANVSDVEITLMTGAPADLMTNYQTIDFVPDPAQFYFNTEYWQPAGPGYVIEDAYPCMPALMPNEGGEVFWASVTDYVFIDLDDDGTRDMWKMITDTNLTFYASNGINLGGRYGYTNQSLLSDQSLSIQQVTPTRQELMQIVQYLSTATDKVILQRYDRTGLTTTLDFITMADLIPAGSVMPNKLRNMIITADNNCEPLSTYSFMHDGTQTIFHAMDCGISDQLMFANTKYLWLDSEPDKPWILSYTMKVGLTCNQVNSDQFLPLLSSLATKTVNLTGNTPNYDWWRAVQMLSLLCRVPPVHYYSGVPYDSYMFHAADGNLYTWTREYGAVKFTATGLFATTLNIPTEVTSENGVQPAITYGGVDAYLCVCDKVKDRIQAVYVGSPFNTWTKLPSITSGYLVYVRPVKVEASEVYLIGVAVVDSTYRFVHLHWKNEGDESWNILGVLPFDVDDDSAFAVSLFGDDRAVQDLVNYPAQPPATAQQAIGTYSHYAVGLP